MHRTHKLHSSQHQQINRRIQCTKHREFSSLLQSPSLVSIIQEEQPEHRKRLFTPSVTLATFISQALNADRSCQAAVNRLAIDRLSKQQTLNSVGTAAYCRARKRLPLTMVTRLARHLGDSLVAATPAAWRWLGRTVKIVDGTTLSMPDTPENQASYPQPASQKMGLGFPLARLVAITAHGSGALINMAMSACKGKGASEHALLRQMLDSFNPGDVVVADRYYCSYALIAELRLRNVDVVMQQHAVRKINFTQGKKLGVRDQVSVWHRPKRPQWMNLAHYARLPECLCVREVCVGQKVLITTLLSPKDASRAQLKKLYLERWQIELSFREIKTTLGMEVLSCKTPDMVEKEVWVYLLGYNLIRWLMSLAAEEAHVDPRTISFKHSVQIWCSVAAHINFKEIGSRKWLQLIAGITVGQRPGRVEPRCRKRRPKPYPLLTKPRPVARRKVRENGHAKKLK